jgi:hypothetical protein
MSSLSRRRVIGGLARTPEGRTAAQRLSAGLPAWYRRSVAFLYWYVIWVLVGIGAFAGIGYHGAAFWPPARAAFAGVGVIFAYSAPALVAQNPPVPPTRLRLLCRGAILAVCGLSLASYGLYSVLTVTGLRRGVIPLTVGCFFYLLRLAWAPWRQQSWIGRLRRERGPSNAGLAYLGLIIMIILSFAFFGWAISGGAG